MAESLRVVDRGYGSSETSYRVKARGSMVRAVITNVFADDNRGGAALTIATARMVRAAFPGCSLGFLMVRGDQSEVTHRHTLAEFPDAVFYPPLLPERAGLTGKGQRLLASSRLLRQGGGAATDVLGGADVVVSKGGQTLRQRLSTRGVIGMWSTTLPLVAAARRGIPTVALGAEVGPFREAPSRWVVRYVLGHVDLVVTRDPVSLSEAHSLKLEAGRVTLLPDLAFSFLPPSDIASRKEAAQHDLDGVRFGAVTVGNVGRGPQGAVFVGLLASLVRTLLTDGVVDVVAAVVQVHGQVVSDLATTERFVAACNDERVRLIVLDGSPDDLIAFYGAARFTIGGRGHSSIFSAVAGTPPFGVGRELKAHTAMGGLGLGHWVIPFPYFDVDVAARTIERIVSEDETARRFVARAATEQRRALEGVPAMLRTIAGVSPVDPNGASCV